MSNAGKPTPAHRHSARLNRYETEILTYIVGFLQYDHPPVEEVLARFGMSGERLRDCALGVLRQHATSALVAGERRLCIKVVELLKHRGHRMAPLPNAGNSASPARRESAPAVLQGQRFRSARGERARQLAASSLTSQRGRSMRAGNTSAGATSPPRSTLSYGDWPGRGVGSASRAALSRTGPGRAVSGQWDWQQLASCRGESTETFYPPDGIRGRERAAYEEHARAICRKCPVLQTCRQYAIAAREPYGIWGALSPADRSSLESRQVKEPRAKRQSPIRTKGSADHDSA